MGEKRTRLPRAIVDLEDYTESQNWLIYGDSGVGKTVFAGQLPNALILATEKGTIAAKRQGSTAKMWPIKHWNDLVAAYEWLEANPTVFDWVVIDTLTDMQQKALRAILQAAVMQNPSRDPDIPAIQDHQKWQNIMKRFINDFNELPMNIMWTAQTMRKEDEEGDDIVLPLLLGKNYEIAAWACAQMHVVGYLAKRSKGKGDNKVIVRRLLCQSVPPYFAKDRYDALGRTQDLSAGSETLVTAADLVAMIEESTDEQKRAANKLRDEDAKSVRAWRGESDDDDDEDEEDDETPTPTTTTADDDDDNDSDDSDDDDEEESEDPAPVRKAAAKKAAKKPAKSARSSKFRATTEDEDE